MDTLKNKKNTKLLLFMCWLVYSTSYIGKVNFSASKLSVMSYFNINESEIGLVGTFFFFAYGIFMVVNGILCKKYNVKYMVFTALMVSSAINLTIPFIPKDYFYIIKYLWLLNGAVLSILWPTLIRLISELLPTNKMSTASKVMGTTVATGTFIIYGLSAVYSKLNIFKFSFFTPAIIVPIVAFLWLILYNRFTDISKSEDLATGQPENTVSNKTKISRNLLIIIIFLAVCAIVTNLMKDGLIGWVPKILKDSYNLPDYVSILMTLMLPLVAVLANFFSVSLSGKIKNPMLFEGGLFLFGGLMILGNIFALATKAMIPSFLMMTMATFIASGSNNFITSIYPLSMKGKINSGLIAGVLNGFCYLGSTISDYGLGTVKVMAGSWHAVFYVLLSACGIVCLFATALLVINIKKYKE
ncbi:MAG: MFS transporter [Ruminococcaceae bacterium]|nr:MFS transporter [Oscillospiraceae bacterium]